MLSGSRRATAGARSRRWHRRSGAAPMRMTPGFPTVPGIPPTAQSEVGPVPQIADTTSSEPHATWAHVPSAPRWRSVAPDAIRGHLPRMRVRWIGLAALCAATATCGTLLSAKVDQELNDKYGKPNPATFDQRPAPAPGAVSYERQIRPLFERRCVVCHGCYDAPCQLKLESWDGIARGASKEPVYKARVRTAELTRLYQDAGSTSGWRERGFFPVLNERGQSRDANLAGSLLYQLLAQKRRHPTPAGGLLPSSFELALDTERKCPRLEEQPEYEKHQPLWGMPYGMPAIDDAEFALIERWLAAGAPAEPPPPLPAAVQNQVRTWEAFFNGDSLKQQLVSRYLFEHLFLAHLHFEGDSERRFFHLVRSRTPPGQPVDRIVTRRPYEPPGVPAGVLPAARRSRDGRGQDPLALRPRRGADAALARAVPRAGLHRRVLALVRPRDHREPLHRVPRVAGAGPVPVPAGRRPLPHHDLHQGAGVPGTGRPQRHRGSLLDGVHRSRFSGGPHGRVPRSRARGAAPAGVGGGLVLAAGCAGAGTCRARRRICRPSPTSSSGSWGRRRRSTSTCCGMATG